VGTATDKIKHKKMKILMILTSHSELGNTGKKTGFWVEEFASPYYVFVDAGATVTIASPLGGQSPVDPSSEAPQAQTDATKRFYKDFEAIDKVAYSLKLSEIKEADYDGVFYPGGHGPLWDLTNDVDSIKLIEDFWKNKKPIAAVCHAPSVLLNVQEANGDPFVKDKNVTGFTNSEEEAVQLTDVVPFLLEDELIKKGGLYSKKEDWKSYVVKDGMLITGQNPASSEEAAKEMVKVLDR
jgi:putative intracellular protease/amidase